MTPADDAAIIELAYAASFVALIDKSNQRWDEAIGEVVPAELERECYRLSTQFGLTPLIEVESLPLLHATWRRQFKHERQRELFDMGNLLVRQHGFVTFVQCHPGALERPEVCFQLQQIRQALTSFFTQYKLKESLTKLPALPLPGAPDAWMNWSGDDLRRCVLRELGGGT
jgi:hypothetical protein